MKEMICIICPRGCHLTISEDMKVSGNFCPRGEKYALSELTNPVRTLTTFVKVNSKNHPTCSVKTNKPVPKKMVLEVKKEIDKILINTPINIGDVIIKNVLGLDVDIVATSKIKD